MLPVIESSAPNPSRVRREGSATPGCEWLGSRGRALRLDVLLDLLEHCAAALDQQVNVIRFAVEYEKLRAHPPADVRAVR